MPFEDSELRKFSEAGRAIAAAADASVEQWARSEAGVILKTWAGRTPSAKDRILQNRGVMLANKRARRAAGFFSKQGHVPPGQASINLGIRGNVGRVYYRTRKAGADGGRAGFQDVYSGGYGRGKHIAPRDWPRVSAFVANFRDTVDLFVAAAKRAGGLSVQSIVQIADDLGIKLESVQGGGRLSADKLAKARAAVASSGQYYRNGYGVTRATAGEFYLTLVNRYPKIPLLFMDQTLQTVIQGRLRYFERNLAEGVFLSAEKTARAYPYLKVLRDAA